jgi:hypothetical protein
LLLVTRFSQGSSKSRYERDVSVRSLRKLRNKTLQRVKGKSAFEKCLIMPWLITGKEIQTVFLKLSRPYEV